MFWIVTAGLFLLAALFVLGPLWLRANSQLVDSDELRKQANIVLFQERSDELEAELSAGNLDQQQFDLLLSELQLGLLADVELKDKAISSANVRPTKPGDNGGALITPTYLMPLAFVLALPVLAYGLYSQWGYIDDVQVMDLFQRTVDNQGDINETRELIVTLGELAQTHPDMPWAFYFLAENFAAVALFEEAQIAYQRAADLLDATPEKALVLGRIAMAMYINAEFEFSSQIRAVIDEARAINPNEMSVLQLLAADAEQREDYSDAIDYWRLMIQVDPNGEFAQELRFRIAAAQEVLAERDGETSGPR
ncbi:MAG: c-type cytochrome biogenesis protein CcmI, partial [Gammaproteobacteria bacterium]|nr:c-type cytochrome biogenesis protein CcmI [Gammaproteobacteria bacterium]